MSAQELNLPITGMTCANCALSVERSVKRISGIKEIQVNFASETARIVYDDTQTDLTNIDSAITEAGYRITSVPLDLPITGMSCANCALTIERILNKTEGILKATVNYANEHLQVFVLVVHICRDGVWPPYITGGQDVRDGGRRFF